MPWLRFPSFFPRFRFYHNIPAWVILRLQYHPAPDRIGLSPARLR
jgi:hypothetical protein